MKIPLAWLSILIAAGCSSGKKENAEKELPFAKKNDLAEYNLSGKVNSVLVTTYQASMVNGRVSAGNPSGWNNAFELKFDKNGKMESLTEYINVKASGKSNRMVTDTVNWVVGRDAEGLRTSLTGRDNKGRFRGVYVYVNTESGKEIQTKSYNYDSSLGYILDHTYDSKNRLAMSEKSNKEGLVLAKLKYSYDSTGNVTEFAETNAHDIVMYRSLKKYNDKGLLIASTETGQGKKLEIRYEYEYDAAGNYIKQIKFQNGSPTEVELRKITYYP